MAKIEPKRIKEQPKKNEFGADDAERILNQLQKEEVKGKKKKIRTTLDLPPDLHADIEEEASNNGQTIRGFFITLARKYFEEKKLKEQS